MSGCPWSRRRFLSIAGGAAALAAGGGFAAAVGVAAERGAPSARGRRDAEGLVSLASGGGPAENARKAIAALGGIGAFVSKGDIVVLKPNIGWDRAPGQAANTDPDLVAAIGEMCLSAGAKEVRVFDRTCNEPRRCYANSGIQDAVEKSGKRHGSADAFRIYHVEERKFVRTAIPGALALKEWDLYRDALEADRIIDVPVAKHHSLAGVTLGLKNMMGVMGGNRGQVHHRLPECLVDLHARLPVHLTVIDATRVLARNGPSGGNLSDVKAVGKVFASADVVAADVAAAGNVFGMKAADVPHLRKALEAGIGVASPGAIRLVGA